MKKTLIALSVLLSLFFGNIYSQTTSTVQAEWPSWKCGTNEVMQKNLEIDPNIQTVFSQFKNAVSTIINSTTAINSPTATYIIPVVFHVISDAYSVTPIPNYTQILWQLATLNAAFSNSLSSLNNINTGPRAVNTQIQFCLAKKMQTSTTPTVWPGNNPGVINYTTTNTALTSNIILTNTTCLQNLATLTNYTLNFPPNMYLNIWCVPNITNLNSGYSINDQPGILGFAEPPWNNLPIDGVVMRNDCIGNNTFNNFQMYQQFDRGAVLAHEVGHYLGLFHTFETIINGSLSTVGSTVAGCYGSNSLTAYSDGDMVFDTPPTFINGNPGAGPFNTCAETYSPYAQFADENDQVENFMSYSDDNGMNTFTLEQAARMWAALGGTPSAFLTGQRYNLVTATNLSLTGVTDVPSCGPNLLTPIFTHSVVGAASTCSTSTIQFKVPILPPYLSATSYTWSFGDGSISNLPNPTHTYTLPTLTYTVQLAVSDGATILIKNQVINIPNGLPKIVGHSGASISVCRGTEQTIYIEFPAGSTSAVLTDGINYYTVTNNRTHTCTIPAGVYRHPFTFTINNSSTFSLVPANCGTVSTGIASFTVIDCCSNLVANGDFENGNVSFYSTYSLNPVLTNAGKGAINFPAFTNYPGIAANINATGKALVIDSYAYNNVTATYVACHVPTLQAILAGQAITGLKPGTNYYLSYKVNQSSDSLIFCPPKFKLKLYSPATGTLVNQNRIPSCIPSSSCVTYTANAGAMEVFNYVVTTPTNINTGTTFSLEILEVENSAASGFDYMIDNIILSEMNPPIIISPLSSTICANSTVQITAANNCVNISNYTLSWQPSNSLSCANCATPVASPSVSTVYTLVAVPPINTPPLPNIVLTASVFVPNATIAITSSTPCSGNFTLTASGLPSVTWQPGGSTNFSIAVSPSVTTTYTVNYSAPSCLYSKTLALNPSQGIPVISVASPTPCNGQFTLTASGTPSILWQPGNLTGSSIVVSPTAITIYTASYSGTTCVTSSTVAISPNATLTTSSSTALTCSNVGNGIVLTSSYTPAYGTINYIWQPGSLSGASQTITPISTTIYTVTASDNNCSSTKTLAVTVPTNCCVSPGVQNFTTTSITSNTFLVGPLKISSDFTIQSGATCVLYGGEFIFTNNAKITVASGGVLNIQGAHLYACGANMWKGIVVKSGGLVFTSAYNGNDNLIEDAETAIDISNYIANTTSVIINVSNAVFNKNYIDINLANYPITSNNYAGAIKLSQCVFTCRDFTFSPTSWPKASLTDLRSATNTTTGLNPPYSLQNAPIVNLKSPYTSGRSHIAIRILDAGTTNTFFPATSTFTFNSINIGSASGGTPTADFILFDAHESFISAANSNVKVSNCVFQNTQTFSVSNTATASAAIQFTSGILNTRLDLTATSPNVGVRFWDCHTAVEVKDVYSLKVENAIFRSTHTSAAPSSTAFPTKGDRGIYVNTNRFEDYSIQYNEFTNLNDAFSMVCAPGSFTAEGFAVYPGPPVVYPIHVYARNATISNNTFCPEINTSFTGPTSNYLNNAITIGGPLNIWFTYGAGLRIENNLIYRAYKGVSFSGLNSIGIGFHNDGPPKIIGSNVITLDQDNIWTSQQKGIEFVNSVPAPAGFPTNFSQVLQSVEYNQLAVYGAPLSNANMALAYGFGNGGTGSVVPSPYMICNDLADANQGFVFDGPNQPTYWRGNKMSNLSRGMSLTNAGRIGQQGKSNAPSDNQWVGTWTGDALYVGSGSIAQQSPLYIRTGSGWVPPTYSGGLPFTNWYNATGGTLTATGAYSCNSSYDQMVVPLPNEELYDSDEVLYIAKMQAYRYLFYHESARNASPGLLSFYEAQEDKSLEKFTQIEDYLSTGNFTAATDILENMDTDFNTVEWNYYHFYELYLRTMDPVNPKFSSFDRADLVELSNLCPGTNGVAVYQARSLYQLLTGRVFNATSNCDESYGSRVAYSDNSPEMRTESAWDVTLFPNPATNQLTIVGKQKSEFIGVVIRDLSGRLILNRELETKDFFVNLGLDLMNGAYLITICNSNNETITKKLLIAK